MPTLIDRRGRVDRRGRDPRGDRYRPREDDRTRAMRQMVTERLRQSVAEHYGIPITEKSERVLVDAESICTEHDDVLRDSTTYRSWVHQLQPLAETANAAGNAMRQFGDRVARFGEVLEDQARARVNEFYARREDIARNYIPTSVTNADTRFLISGDSMIRWHNTQITSSITNDWTYLPVANATITTSNQPYVWDRWIYESRGTAQTQYTIPRDDHQRLDTRWFVNPAYEQEWPEIQRHTWDAWEQIRDRNHEGLIYDPAGREYVTPEVYSARQLERQRVADELRAERIARDLETQAQRAEAESRAEELLMTLLSADQRREWVEHKLVTVVTPSGRVFELRHGWAGNVVEIDPATRHLPPTPKMDVSRSASLVRPRPGTHRRRLRSYCIHPRDALPIADNIATQLLELQFDEARFLQIANVGA